MATLKKRGNKFSLRFVSTIEGKRQEKSIALETGKKEIALKLKRKLEVDYESGDVDVFGGFEFKSTNIVYIRSKPSINGSAESAIFLINLEEKENIVRLTESTTGLINLGNFSPDGNYIVYVKTDSESQKFDEREIYKVDTNGTNNPTRLTNNSTSDTDPKWSPVK